MMTVADINTLILQVVAGIGGVGSALITIYGGYRKINKEYGIDELNNTKRANKDLLEQIERKDELIDQLNTLIQSLREVTDVSHDSISELAKKTKDVSAQAIAFKKNAETLESQKQKIDDVVTKSQHALDTAKAIKEISDESSKKDGP